MKKAVGYLLVWSLIFIASCTENEFEELEIVEDEIKSKIQLEIFDSTSKIPRLDEQINSIRPKGSEDWFSKDSDEDILIDNNRIIKVVDSIGNSTFSIRFYKKNTPYNVFYNMIIKQDAQGVYDSPLIFRYEIEEDYYETYKTSSRKDAPFKGNIKAYTSTNFFASNILNSKNPELECIDHQSGDSGSGDSGEGSGGSSGGSGGDSSNGTGHDPGSWSTYYVANYNTDYGGGSGQDTQPFVEIGEGSFTDDCPGCTPVEKSYTGKIDDCPEDDLLVPINEEETANPCKEMEKIAKDLAIISKLKELKNKTGENKEYGVTMNFGENTTFSNLISGQADTPGINLAINSPIDGFMHSHYDGLLSTFSDADIKSIYDLYKSGKINKWRTFVMMLVTEDTAYTLKIGNKSRFLAFGDQNLKTGDGYFLFGNFFNGRVNSSNTDIQNELGLMSLLEDSGLVLFKGNPITLDNWNGIKLTAEGNAVQSDDCK